MIAAIAASDRVTRFRERLRNNPRIAGILHGGFASLVGKGTGILVTAISLPIIIRYLGKFDYGLWVTISTSITMLSVLDLGISSTLTTYIAKAHTRDDRALAHGYFSTAFWITVAIALLLGAVLGIVWSHISWEKLFAVHNASDAHQAAGCVAVGFGFFLLNLPLSLASRVLAGYQQVQVASYFGIIGSVSSLIAVLLAVFLHLDLIGLTFCFSAGMLTSSLALNVWLCVKSRPWIRPSLRAIQAEKARDLFSEGMLFFILQIAGLVMFNSDNLIITHYLGASEVTPYSVAWRLMTYASMIHGLLIPALWPAFSDAYFRKELIWVKHTYGRAMRTTMTGVCAVALLLAVSGRWIIRIWATRAAVPSVGLLWAMALWAVILSLTTNQACLLAATQRLRLQAVTAVLAAVLNLILTIHWVRPIGTLGVIGGTLVSYLVFIVVPQEWEVRNILRGKYLESVNA